MLAAMPRPKDPWSSPTQEMRKRKKVQVTLSDEARAKLVRLASVHEDRTQSAVVEDLIMKAGEKNT